MSDARTMHFDMPVRAASRTAGTAPSRAAERPHARTRLALSARRARVHARPALPFSPVALSLALALSLAVTYIALIATVMSYATMTVGFSQSVRDDEAQVALLESQYLSAISSVTATDYVAQGYEKPAHETFVPAAPATALR